MLVSYLDPGPELRHLAILIEPVSVQRKVLRQFRFSEGLCVPAGNIVCVPQQAVMRDPQYYRDTENFNGFRFIAGEKGEVKPASKFTDVKPTFPFCVKKSLVSAVRSSFWKTAD